MARLRTLYVVAFVSLWLLPAAADASELLWGGGGYSWGLGDSTNGYLVDGVTLSVSINDLNTPLALDPNTEPLGSPGSPQTSAFLDPVGNGGDMNLFLKAPGNTNGVEITLVFDTPVTSVNFETFDVDATGASGLGDYIDRLHVEATNGGSAFGPSSVTGNGSEVWALQPDGRTIEAFENADQTAGNSADGTALWSFDVPLTSLTITYENADPTAGVQWIGLSHISFEVVPEPSTGVLFGLGLVGMACHNRGARRRAVRRSPSHAQA